MVKAEVLWQTNKEVLEPQENSKRPGAKIKVNPVIIRNPPPITVHSKRKQSTGVITDPATEACFINGLLGVEK